MAPCGGRVDASPVLCDDEETSAGDGAVAEHAAEVSEGSAGGASHRPHARWHMRSMYGAFVWHWRAPAHAEHSANRAATALERSTTSVLDHVQRTVVQRRNRW